MKKSRYSESQIIGILKDADSGVKVQVIGQAANPNAPNITAATREKRFIRGIEACCGKEDG